MPRCWVMMAAVAASSVLGSPALAVKTAVWTHEQPKDFMAGKLDGVVVTSLGEVTLGRQTETLGEAEQADVINALARAGDGAIYVATGPSGIIYRIKGDEMSEFARLPDGGTVLSLLFTRDGKLLAGSGGGDQAAIYRIDGTGRVTTFHTPAEARYVWAMARGADGEIYAATGIEGQLFVIDPDGSAGRVLADVKPKNLLCLAAGADGTLYAGTDGDGLVYRISPEGGKAYVMYDASEPEISAIVLDAEGNVFACTASADAARPGRAVADKPGGKPDHGTGGVGAATQPVPNGSNAPASQPENGGNGSADLPEDEDTADDGDDGDGDEDGGGEDEAEPASPTSIPRRLGRAVPTGKVSGTGNAIYRIDTTGFVTEIFREPVMVLAMAEADGTIYAATGNEGRIYAVSPADDRTIMLAKLEPSQATTLLRLPDRRLIVGTANDPMLVAVSDRPAEKGTLTSTVLDAGQIVKWGRLKWGASVPAGTRLSVATRSGNVEDDESEAWDDWSAEMDATQPQQVPSVSARFLQYRVSFATSIPDAAATLRSLEIAYVQENRAPLISALSVDPAREEAKKPGAPSKVKAAAGASSPGDPEPDYQWVVRWKAEDANKDALVYEVLYRELGSTRWIRIEKETKEAYHIWDTRTVADGRYEARVVAKDIKANPPGTELTHARISDPFTVDNTPPGVTVRELKAEGADSLAVHAAFVDERSPIAEAAYSVDSDEEWVPIAPADDIFDAPTESVLFTIRDLEPGEHRIALRVRDAHGNTAYAYRAATIGN